MDARYRVENAVCVLLLRISMEHGSNLVISLLLLPVLDGSGWVECRKLAPGDISVAGQLITQLQIVCAEGKESLLVPEISAIAIVDESSARGSPE